MIVLHPAKNEKGDYSWDFARILLLAHQFVYHPNVKKLVVRVCLSNLIINQFFYLPDVI
jgi:hypothetical protein